LTWHVYIYIYIYYIIIYIVIVPQRICHAHTLIHLTWHVPLSGPEF
jgi:hypothetical protein